jgi:hypothetical protein
MEYRVPKIRRGGFVFTMIVCLSCMGLHAQDITYIDLTRAVFAPVNAERIFEDIEVVPLETHEDGLLRFQSVSYYLTDNYIIAADFFHGAYLFDRKTGKFIRKITSFGQGPNDYAGFIFHQYAFD